MRTTTVNSLPPLGNAAWCRRMVRFEFAQARAKLATGRPDRAAVALRRARLWRQWAHEKRRDEENPAPQRS